VQSPAPSRIIQLKGTLGRRIIVPRSAIVPIFLGRGAPFPDLHVGLAHLIGAWRGISPVTM